MFDKVKNIKLNSIVLKNFMSFGDITLTDLDKYKILFISGTNALGKSTLTSEAIYFALFGKSLRFSSIKKLFKWGVPATEDALSKVGLAIETVADYTSIISVTRNITKDPRFSIEIENDTENFFGELKDITNSKKINNIMKHLLELDESKFSVLYLKSPFSDNIFESDSNLLSSITKVNFINELRTDFNGIVNDVASRKDSINISINKQKHTLDEMTKQINELLKLEYSTTIDNSELLTLKEKEINESKNKLTKVREKKLEINMVVKENNRLHNEYTSAISEYNTKISQLRESYQALQGLINRGKCPKCFQDIKKGTYDTEFKEIVQKADEIKLKLADVTEKNITIKALLNNYNNDITKYYNYENSVNDSILKLTSEKAKIQNDIKSLNINKQSNEIIIENITAAITELNSEFTILLRDYTILNLINTKLLNKKSEYINQFYNKKIEAFTDVFRSILITLTKSKYYDVKIKLDNKPILNGDIEYEALSTSERKYIDAAFTISYIVFLSSKMKFRTFILDEFLDNIDSANIINIYNVIYDIANKYNLQFIFTTNFSDKILNKILHTDTNNTMKIINLRKIVGIENSEEFEDIYDI